MNKTKTTADFSLPVILQQVRQQLDYLAGMGCRGFDCSSEQIKRIKAWGKQPAALSPDECSQCLLSTKGSHRVDGCGNPRAKLMFVGGCPEPEDGGQGKPFSGPAGDLLTKIIQAMGFDRKDVYICHAIQCSPPAGNFPLSDVARRCRSFLIKQIERVQPKFVCTLGPVAAEALLQTGLPLESIRGKFHEIESIQVMPTHHPAELIRDPGRKRAVWEDMKLVMKAMQK